MQTSPTLLLFLLPAALLIISSGKLDAAKKRSNSGSASKPPASQSAIPQKVPPPVDYNFQIRPLLANACFKCHGPDEKARKAKLRLDTAEDAHAKAITPGNAAESEIIKRILSTDPEEVMPPPDSHLELKPEDRELLKTWIQEGAKYDRHWSFKLIEKPEPDAAVSKDKWVKNPIDSFVLEQLKSKNIKPAEAASKERWIRRVSMDLTGLPPSIEEVDQFLKDTTAGAFETVVDRLLASPHFGERMALDWLDAARYADTFGRHEDPDSLNYPYRDWAIRTFNQNVPYDQFIEWQIAGDMIPEATPDTTLATAFNRLHQQSNEAGSDEEEFRCEHVADRTKTTAQAFLGLSMECARCHDHKYDPISTKEYYAFGAFLNNIDEMGLAPRFTSSVPTPKMIMYADGQEAEHRKLLKEIETRSAALAASQPEALGRFKSWLAAGNKPVIAKPIAHIPFEGKLRSGPQANIADPARPCEFKFKPEQVPAVVGKGVYLKGDMKLDIPDTGNFRRHEPFTLSIMLQPRRPQARAILMHHTAASTDAASRGYELLLDEMRLDFCLAHFWPGDAIRIRAKSPLPLNEWSHITATYDGSSKAAGMRLYRNGRELECDVIADHLTLDILYDAENGDLDPTKVADADLSANLPLEIADRRNDAGLEEADIDEIKVFDRCLAAPEVSELAGVSPAPASADWFEWYLRDIDSPTIALTKELFAARMAENDFSKKLQQMMVMKEHNGPRRKTWVLTRGQFNLRGEEVQPDVPASILPFPPGLARDRFGLAKWLTDARNPLTSRVTVNRYWQIFFGKGIVATPEDFGIQGALPTHPRLLDWLAFDFRENGWNLKRLCKLISLSATYRQSIRPSDSKLLAQDPENRLLARGPHHRWNAEMLRDQFLAVSGLLVSKIGGPSVKPYQPAGLWEDSGTQHTYVQDKGEDLYRRSMYSFWRRTMPPPSMTIFDAPTREYCVAKRERTASPMQALVLMNDPQIMENARVLAEQLLKLHPGDLKKQIIQSFRLCTSRAPSPAELSALTRLHLELLERFRLEPADVKLLLSKNGERPVDASLTAIDVAALTMVNRTIFNCSEAVLKY